MKGAQRHGDSPAGPMHRDITVHRET